MRGTELGMNGTRDNRSCESNRGVIRAVRTLLPLRRACELAQVAPVVPPAAGRRDLAQFAEEGRQVAQRPLRAGVARRRERVVVHLPNSRSKQK